LLHEYLAEHKGEPRIAWYPSADDDFRALLYLDVTYADVAPAIGPEPLPPDIFLLSDFNKRVLEFMHAGAVVHEDKFTTVRIDQIEELPPLDLPQLSRIAGFRRHYPCNRAFFMMVSVVSTVLGSFTRPVIYAVAENEALFCDVMHPNNVRLSHIVNVRYGGGLGGGGRATGSWMMNILRQVGCEVYISDDHLGWQDGDDMMLEMCPAVPRTRDVHLHPIRMIPGVRWSNFGDVSWNLVTDKESLAAVRAISPYQPNTVITHRADEPPIPLVIGGTAPNLIVVCSIASMLVEMVSHRCVPEKLSSLPDDNPISERIADALRKSRSVQPDLYEFWRAYCALIEEVPVFQDYYMEYTKTRYFWPFAQDSRLNKTERLVKWNRRRTYNQAMFRRQALGRYPVECDHSEPLVTFLEHDAFMESFTNYVAGDTIDGYRLSSWFTSFEEVISGASVETPLTRVRVLFLEELTSPVFTAIERFQRRYNTIESQEPGRKYDPSRFCVYNYYGLPPGVPEK
jgi:hypothetical protein